MINAVTQAAVTKTLKEISNKLESLPPVDPKNIQPGDCVAEVFKDHDGFLAFEVAGTETLYNAAIYAAPKGTAIQVVPDEEETTFERKSPGVKWNIYPTAVKVVRIDSSEMEQLLEMASFHKGTVTLKEVEQAIEKKKTQFINEWQPALRKSSSQDLRPSPGSRKGIVLFSDVAL